MRNLALGAAASVLMALVMIVPSIFGISTWKIVLGALGLGLIVLSGRGSRTDK